MGRLAVIAAAALGLAAVVGYGITQSRARSQARAAAAEQVEATPRTSTATIPDLTSRAHEARLALDTTALARYERELAKAAEQTSAVPKALEARRERLAVLGSLAVEASLRAQALGDGPAAQQANEYVGEGQALARQLDDQLEPGLALATQARLTFASGGDVPSTHPSVLLPAFRDRELQHAVLTRELLRPADPDEESSPEGQDDSPAALVGSLESIADPTGLEQALLALTLQATGKSERANHAVNALLAAVPDQPLALALREQLRRGALVAVAENPSEDDIIDPIAQPEPEPEPEPEPVAQPEPEPVAQPKPEPVAQPKPEPKPKPESDKPKPKTDKPKPKPKRLSPEELTNEGCRLVRSGNAQQGFDMLQKAFDLNPRDTKVTLCMSEGHMKLGRLPSARAMVERVLGTAPRNKRALMLAAKIENKMGNKRAAADYYRKVLELEPGNATAQAYIDANG